MGEAELGWLTEQARQLLNARYFLRDKAGNVTEDFNGLVLRVADALASAEQQYGGSAAVEQARELFHRPIVTRRLLPSSPILMNAGTPTPFLAACYVVPIEDSIESIMQGLKCATLIQKTGGGTGFSFSHLRPAGSPVAGTNGIASGPVSFIGMFDAASQAIKQGGRRRGANMAMLHVTHPDVIQFAEAKSCIGQLGSFNLSVAVTDAFMEAVAADAQFDLVAPYTGEAVGKASARDILHRIAKCAWRTGDPGVVFLDEVNRRNPLPALGPIEATNPCGEQPLEPWGACCLASIDLSPHVQSGEIDWDALAETVQVGVKLLDDAIDASSYPLEQIERTVKASRKIGLGIMGLAHALAKLGIPYNSEEGVRWAEKVMSFISQHALEASRLLAKERGPFPAFQRSVYAERGEPPLRNATRTTVAPTGSLSIIADTSSGIEPIFALAYTRTILGGKSFSVVDPAFREVAQACGIFSDDLARKVAETGSVQAAKGFPDDLKAVFKTAHEITPEWHVRMQAAIQRHTDNAVSKTVNLPASATAEDVERVFLLAHNLGCKGITVFRQGCRTGVLNAGVSAPQYAAMRSRPKLTLGSTEKFRSGCGSLYVHVTHDDGGPLEAFSNLGKGGGCPAQSEATARLASLCLRCNVDPQEIVRQLRGIRCPTACSARAEGKPVDVLSCPDAIAQALARASRSDEYPEGEIGALERCPKCGGRREPGRCGVCLSCWEGGCEGA